MRGSIVSRCGPPALPHPWAHRSCARRRSADRRGARPTGWGDCRRPGPHRCERDTRGPASGGRSRRPAGSPRSRCSPTSRRPLRADRARAASSADEIDHAVPPTGRISSLPPQMRHCVRSGQHRLAARPPRRDSHRRAPIPRSERRADDGEVVASVPPDVKKDLAGLGAQRESDLAAGLVQPGAGGPAEPVRAGWIPECLLPSTAAWPHGPPDGPAWWRRGRGRWASAHERKLSG